MAVRFPKTKGMLRREAAGWLARLQSGRDPDIERKFVRWRDSDSRHSEAFERVSQSYDRAALLRHSRKLSPERDVALRQPLIHWRPAVAVAAAAAIAVLIPAGIAVMRNGGRLGMSSDAVMLTTGIGEIRQVELGDGSRVTLDTSTKLDVEIARSHRTAHLRYGRARFSVARAAVPFVVDAQPATVSSNGGVIDVDRRGPEPHVHVLVGSADVSSLASEASPSVALEPGEAAAIADGRVSRTTAIAKTVNWPQGMLQFDATPLRQAVEEANRYSERRIVLVGDVGARRVTGTFRAGDTAGLAKALASAFALSLTSGPGGQLMLTGTTPRSAK